MNDIISNVNNYIKMLILPSDPLRPLWNRENIIFRKEPKWNYMDHCMIRALLGVYELTGRQELLEYAESFVSEYVESDGSIPTIRTEDHNLDSICGGRNLIALSKFKSSRKTELACEKLYTEQLLNQPRLDCGNFWHKAIYPRQLWLDGAYMALPFMAEYALKNGDTAAVRDALSQLENIRSIMRDKNTGLYYHGYDETKTMYWADPETGLSPQFWLRSMGWLCAGLADISEITGDNNCGEMLADLLDALKNCITDDDMLMQLPALPELDGNYPETSGTLLFAYAAMKAYRLGICGSDIRSAGENTLMNVNDNYIMLESSGLPVLGNICLMGGLGGAQHRDGSPEYYLSEPVVWNDAKGIAPYIMASTELLLS